MNAKPLKLKRICWFLVCFKLLYFIILSAAMLAWPLGKEEEFFHIELQEWTSDGHLSFGSHFTSWDAEHYLAITAQGYETGVARCAFYPLFPMAVRYFSFFTGGSHVIAGMLLANLFSFAGDVLFFLIVRKRFGETTAWFSLILLLAFPGALFFQFIYTESLFFLLLMLLVYGLEHTRMSLAYAGAFLLPLTRAVGIFCIFPIAWNLLFKTPPPWLVSLVNRWSWSKNIFWSVGGRQKVNGSEAVIEAPSNGASLWLLVTPFLGWAVYLFQMWLQTGNAFEGFDAQKLFGMQSMDNLFHLTRFVKALCNSYAWCWDNTATLDRCSFLLLFEFLLLIWMLDRSWFLWAFFLGVVPAVTGTFTSYTRFASVVFPLFIALAVFMNKEGLFFRCLRLLTVATFLVFHILFLWRFVNYRWVG